MPRSVFPLPLCDLVNQSLTAAVVPRRELREGIGSLPRQENVPFLPKNPRSRLAKRRRSVALNFADLNSRVKSPPTGGISRAKARCRNWEDIPSRFTKMRKSELTGRASRPRHAVVCRVTAASTKRHSVTDNTFTVWSFSRVLASFALGSWFRSAQLRIENCGVSRSRDGQCTM